MIFLYDCKGCGSHDELPPAGGKLSCTCEKPDPSGKHMLVTKVVDGSVEFRKTIAEIMVAA